ncbi:hypothetical protein [Natronobiforma cellulositropha]|uniref:hypothetical protein n=1 Tax=Natronobiforma cellulositropha TaxID=1679076 RepID=UPI0021D603AE|nr:hypothetical protein [Natronobiforma cellulositropha]
MATAEPQRKLARRAMWVSLLLGLLALWFFTSRGEPVTGFVVFALLGGGGYFEYKRRLKDLEAIDTISEDEDPFERRDRFR